MVFHKIIKVRLFLIEEYSMIELIKISKNYGDKSIFDNVNLELNNQVVALIGQNGSGKTTLLKILTGEIKPDDGQILREGEVFGYVSQEHQLPKRIDDNFNYSNLWRLQKALDEVGLDKQLDSKTDNLSEGQKTKLSLAYLLAQNPTPTALLLDEPTNNLDRATIIWLVNFINQFAGSILLASHNRDFINQTCSGVFELKNKTLTAFKGNYEDYKRRSKLELDHQIESHKAQTKESRRLEAALKPKRQYMLEADAKLTSLRKPVNFKVSNQSLKGVVRNSQRQVRFGRKIESIRSRLDQIDKVEKPDIPIVSKLNLENSNSHSGKQIFKIEDVDFSYRQQKIYQQFNLSVFGNQRLRIAGNNGVGKTTLLKLIIGDLQPTSGLVQIGPSVSIGYLSQTADNLDYRQSALDNLLESNHDQSRIYREVKALLFDLSDLNKKPDQLSRGQKTKIGLVKILLSCHDLLILDEITNHLDIPTIEAAEVALRDYQGSLLVVSHDDYFVKQIKVDKTVNLDDQKLQS